MALSGRARRPPSCPLSGAKRTSLSGRAAAANDHAVEKGKNEPIEIFAFAPVETGFSQSEGSQ